MKKTFPDSKGKPFGMSICSIYGIYGNLLQYLDSICQTLKLFSEIKLKKKQIYKCNIKKHNFKSSFGAPCFVPHFFVISATLTNIEQKDQ